MPPLTRRGPAPRERRHSFVNVSVSPSPS
ncbi:hypothetical protein EMCLV146R [Equine molluscum contagiosum-like virus]|nr:hypothetical protein EMCLV146R [Equine molluscum contagiosum-like virus]